jgi:threonylcarbamoyladenosine tRNA methylthiotransferase MtaB
MKVALHNLGCKVNAYETDVMQQKLTENGYEIVNYDEKADVFIVNTCSVTNMADRKSRQILHRAKKNNPDAIVVAMGCYVQMNEEEADKDDAVDIIIGNNKKNELIEILDSYFCDKNIEKQKEDKSAIVEGQNSEHHAEHHTIDINAEVEYEEMWLTDCGSRTRADIKIQDGCNQFCTYCIIPYARGRIRSRKQDNILKEVRGLAEKGYQEIVLTGIHISSYGKDFDEKDPFALAKLMENINEIDGIKRIRIGSFEPRILTEAFVDRLSKIEKLCPHFHLSLQSGSDATLKRMNRAYTTAEYREKVELLRRAFDRPAITTDVIVGFPGETEEEFNETVEFVKQIQFFEMHVFKYSRRKGTKADEMPNQVAEDIKTKRSKVLLEVAKEQGNAFRKQYLDEEVEVLFEESKVIRGKEYQIGHTPEYIKVVVEGKESLDNQLVRVKTNALLGNDLLVASCILE